MVESFPENITYWGVVLLRNEYKNNFCISETKIILGCKTHFSDIVSLISQKNTAPQLVIIQDKLSTIIIFFYGVSFMYTCGHCVSDYKKVPKSFKSEDQIS